MRKKLIIFVLILVFITAFLLIGNFTVKTTTYTITSSKIDEGIIIAQISDFHDTPLKKQIIQKLKKESPDIIVITGDFIDYQRCDINGSINFIKAIKDIAPIYYATGNHEAGQITKFKEMEKELNNLGVNILHDESETLNINNNNISIIGLDDPDYHKVNKSKKTTISSIEFDTDNFCLLLSHRPELFKDYQGFGIDLVLTGHAHGGQIRIPFFGGIYAPHQGLFPEYTSGIFGGETKMIVSRGIGNSRFPIRINNTPELVIINLEKNNFYPKICWPESKNMVYYRCKQEKSGASDSP